MIDTITAPILAQLFIPHVFSKHGVPSHITSDCGSEFISSFFQTLGKALAMKLHFTSGYHPKGNGQTDRMNQTLEQPRHEHMRRSSLQWSRASGRQRGLPRGRPHDNDYSCLHQSPPEVQRWRRGWPAHPKARARAKCRSSRRT